MLKLSLYLHFDEYLMVKVRVLEGVRSAAVVHCIYYPVNYWPGYLNIYLSLQSFIEIMSQIDYQ